MDLVDIDPLERLAASIRDRSAVVAVIGLGYVGLPLLVAVRQAGFETIGLDVDHAKIETLTGGRSYIVDVPSSEIAGLDRTTFTDDAATLARADVVVLCLPTPLADGAPDLSMVRTAAETVARAPSAGHARDPRVDDVARHHGGVPSADPGGRRSRRRRRTSRSPTRPSGSTPGTRGHRLTTTPKIVSGLTDRCRDLAVSFYAPIVGSIAVTASTRATPRWPS